jgi:hypothetical protein
MPATCPANLIFLIFPPYNYLMKITSYEVHHYEFFSSHSLSASYLGPQSRSGRSGGEEKNSQPLPGLEPPIIQPVAQHYTTELTRLTVSKNM